MSMISCLCDIVTRGLCGVVRRAVVYGRSIPRCCAIFVFHPLGRSCHVVPSWSNDLLVCLLRRHHDGVLLYLVHCFVNWVGGAGFALSQFVCSYGFGYLLVPNRSLCSGFGLALRH